MTRDHAPRLRNFVVFCALLSGLIPVLRAGTASGPERPVPSLPERLPLSFEPNLGQTDPRVRFVARAKGMTVFLTDHGSVMALSRRRDAPRKRDVHKAPELEQAIVRMKLEGASAPRVFEGVEKLASISNYFIGNVPSKWLTNIPNFQKVQESGVYSGIDLLFYGDGRKLEYDFVVRPGADPASIHMAYEGADGLAADEQGNLLIATRLGTLVQGRPFVYQEIDGKRRQVQASYSIRAGKVEFVLANWDRKRDLVIDPALEYSTFVGGTGGDESNAIAVDSAGAAFITGFTRSIDYPTIPGGLQTVAPNAQNAFVTKLNSTGSALIYSTYLGGAGNDIGNAIALDTGGSAYVTGSTTSNDFPTTMGAYQTSSGGSQDVFVAKLNSAGNGLTYSTYIGKSGQQAGAGIAVDSSGNAYITGFAGSNNYPTTPGAFQTNKGGGASDSGIVTKLNAAGSALVYSTYLGGKGEDQGFGIALDSSDNAYITGFTSSPDFPITTGAFQTGLNGVQDAFITKLNAAGSALGYSTYLGGSGYEQGFDIAVDSTGNAYVTGYTTSNNFPATPGAFQTAYGGGAQDAFVTKLSAGGNALAYSTYLGGSGFDTGSGILVNSGAAYVVGYTSGNFPITPAAYQTVFGGASDLFITKLDAAGDSLAYSTYLGGSNGELINGRGIALDASGAIYVTGFTYSPDFPTTPGSYKPTASPHVTTASEGFITKLGLPGPPASIVTYSGTPQSTTVGTAFPLQLQVKVTDANGNGLPGITVTFSAPSTGASANLSDGTAVTNSAGIATVTATANTTVGSYSVTATVSGVGSAAFSLTNISGSVQTIAFVQQPSNATAGAIITPAVTVKVTDAYNNPIAGAVVTMGLQEAGSTLGGTLTQNTNAAGIATFGNLDVTKAGTYHLKASASSLNAVSNAFTITAGTAISITAVSGGGQSATVGTAYAAALKALVADTFGNPIQGASVMFTAPGSGASVTFGAPATVTTDSTGVATSPAMTANGQTGAFQVSASTSGVSTPAVFSLTNVAGTANKLAFVQQPTDTVAGANINPPVTVQLQDSFGNPAHEAGVPVTLTLTPGIVPGRLRALPSFPSQPTDVNGLATFSSISVTQAGTYQLLAMSTNITSATSNPFNVTAGIAAAIQATGGTPQTTSILTPFVLPLQATVTDTFGNPVSNATVSFTAPGVGASATLSAASAVTDSSGHASVTATANATAGAYTVGATTPGVLQSASFLLVNVAGPVGQIVFVQQPSNAMAAQTISPPVTVKVTDSGGNPVTGSSVTVSLQASSVVLNGTLTAMTDSSGVATFSDLSVNTAGSYRLVAATVNLSTVSSAFVISASTSSVIISVFDGDGQSAPVSGAYGAPLKALVDDLYGNPLTGASVTFTAPATGPSATFSGAATVVTDSSGIATSPALTANSQPGSFQVAAGTSGAAAPALFTLTNTPVGANRLGFVQQPTDTAAGTAIMPPVTVQLQDSSGNPLPMAGVPITIQSNAVVRRLRLLSGNTTVNTDANGLATFSGLSMALAGPYTLTASATAADSATSNPFNVTAGPASVILATGGTPQSAIINTIYGAPLQATVTDSLANPISGVQVTFTAPTSGASGLFGGQSSVTVVTDALGHASAVITANATTGSFAAVASASSVSGSAQFVLTNLPVATGVLVFVQQPSNTAAAQVITPPVAVQVQDGSGHPIAVAGVPALISLYAGTGNLQGTLVQVTDSTGTATFNNLTIAQTGTKQLRAVSSGQSPAISALFQITAGAAATISVFSGSPQATTVLQPFPTLLQAQVTDSASNPVSGVTVSFTVSNSSGAGGTFGAPATAVTDNGGIATAPILTANGQTGAFTVTTSASGVGSQAVFSLVNLPQSSGISVYPPQLAFTSEVNQPAPPSQTVQITAGVSWNATSSASWLSAQPAGGTGSGQIAVSVNPAGLSPGTYNGLITIGDTGGNVAVILVTYTVANKAALVVAPPVLVFATPNNTITPSAQTLQITSSSRPIAYTVTAQISTPSGGSWLQVSPLQGQTVGMVTVSVNPAGLSSGIYNGSILFTPADPTVNSVAVPVTLIVDCEQGNCELEPNILAVVNGASFHPTGAPGAIMTIFGTQLSDAVYQAQSYPLPTTLGPTSVTVNGVPAPLFYASPTQINFQMPSGVPASGVTVVVNNSAVSGPNAFRASPSHIANLTNVDPGVFLSGNGRAAALNVDLTPNTPQSPAPIGGYILLFLTGQGPVTPAVGDGMPAPLSPLSIINGRVQVFIGGENSQVTYQGLAPNYAGLAQINVIVPSGLTPGDQPVFVTINGVASNAAIITVK